MTRIPSPHADAYLTQYGHTLRLIVPDVTIKLGDPGTLQMTVTVNRGTAGWGYTTRPDDWLERVATEAAARDLAHDTACNHARNLNQRIFDAVRDGTEHLTRPTNPTR